MERSMRVRRLVRDGISSVRGDVVAAAQAARRRLASRVTEGIGLLLRGARGVMGERTGQGTTEYAILVGVLVVIAILAIAAFRGKVQELWSAIADGINGL
ncbi:class III signal peptide [bacterium]|nr:class III signal peptide [bacterium]